MEKQEKVKEKRERLEAVEVKCPKCRYLSIIYIPQEDIPKCPECGTQMVINELLDEGKSY
jgi:ribosomal protein S27E